MSTHFTTIETSEKPASRDWSAAGFVAVAIILFFSLILFAVSAFAGIRAMQAHREATAELNITLRQLHLKNELTISELEHREPRLRPSESPLPE